MQENKNTVIVIAGPTASGKTALSLKLAQQYNTDIISADSRQCFKELNIAVAKPTGEELNSVKHYFINSHSIHEKVTAQTFEQYALQAADEIFKKNKVAVMVGGTGMYIKTFCEGLDEIPETHSLTRDKIIQQYQQYGLEWLQEEVKKNDPLFWAAAEQQNPRRLMRALEVWATTGKSFTSFKTQTKKERPFNIFSIGIDLPKEVLYNNIDRRVEHMVDAGLFDEARSLLPFAKMNALQTVGYKECFEYFASKKSFSETVSAIKSNTRKYAKRQLTWFKKDKNIHWMDSITVLPASLPF